MKVKIYGKENIMRLEMGETDAGVPEIKKVLLSQKDCLIGEYDVEQVPQANTTVALDENTEIYITKVTTFLSGGASLYTNHVTKEVINEDEQELMDRYKEMEMKKFVSNLKNNNPEFIEFLKLFDLSENSPNGELVEKFSAFNGFIKHRDANFR